MARNVAVILLALMAAFAAGWRVAVWQRDSSDLLIERAASAAGDKARSELQGVASQSGRKLEDQLGELKSALPHAVRTELEKGVFTAVCLSDDFIGMYNSAAEKAERTLSGKPENKMSH